MDKKKNTRRASVSAEKYCERREEFYEKDARSIAWELGVELIEHEQSVDIKITNEEILSCKPTSQKSFWFEVWTTLRHIKEDRSI